MMKDKKVLVGGALLLAAVFWFYVKPNYLDAKPAAVFTQDQIANAEKPTLFIGKSPDPEVEGSKGVVFNLKAPTSTPKYARVVIAIEFEDPDQSYVGVTSAAAITAKNIAFKEEMEPEMHKILDTVTTIFGAKTIEDVSTTEGKEQLKADLIEGLNAQLHGETVEAIYFESFITQ